MAYVRYVNVQLSLVCVCGGSAVEYVSEGMCRRCYQRLKLPRKARKPCARPLMPKVSRDCGICGKQFETINNPRFRYCSRRCGDLGKCGIQCDTCGKPMYKDRTSQKKSAIARCHSCRQTDPAPYGPRDGGETGSASGRPRSCDQCGATFRSVLRSTGKWSRFCSRACSDFGQMKSGEFSGKGHIARALRSGGRGEPVNRNDVFERDGWLCGICGLGIDPGLRWPDRGSASLDHIVPLSIGGDHTYMNVQASHLWCNLSKGGTNRPGFARAA